MKKAFSAIAALVFALTSIAPASAQDTWEYGIKGGVALNMMPGTTVTPGDELKSNFGFQGGVFLAYNITDMLTAQIELQYSRKGVHTVNHTPQYLFDGDALDYRRNIHYLQIPLLIGISSFANNRIRIMVGPELGIYLDDKVKANHWDPVFDNDLYVLNPFNLAIGLQATYFITPCFGFEVKGDFGLTRTFKKETEDKGRNTGIQFGLCLRFGN